MYELYITRRSPFARRVRLALQRLDIKYLEKETDVFEPAPEFLQRNPLGLIPVMTLSDGTHLPDSNTILEYLDDAHPGQIWPTDSAAERVLVRQASTWATGVMTASVALFLEKKRKAADSEWLEEHSSVILETLAALDKSATLRADRMTQASWDLGVALEYLDLRTPELPWRKDFYRLESILLACRKHSAFIKTSPGSA